MNTMGMRNEFIGFKVKLVFYYKNYIGVILASAG